MRFERLKQQIGQENLRKLESKKICVLGIGGVGSYAIEALARSNIGTLIILDNDIVDETNINRQLIALSSTIGKKKVDVMEERIHDINPKAKVIKKDFFLNQNTLDLLFQEQIDFLIDAIDTISTKYLVIKHCISNDIPFISSMGTGNKLDPSKFHIVDLKKTEIDPIARKLRLMLRDDNIKKPIPVLISKEIPLKGNSTPSSNAFTPSVAGLMCAAYVINTILEGD